MGLVMSEAAGTSNRETYEDQPATAGPSKSRTGRILDQDQALHEEPLQEELSQPQPFILDERTVWDQRNLLTFGTHLYLSIVVESNAISDGGGIRGFWSLLALRQLMDLIYAFEIHHPERHLHSFHPKPFPRDASQVLLSKTEKRYKRIHTPDDNIPDKEVEALDPARRYLPCHYFDYIGGTSTGA